MAIEYSNGTSGTYPYSNNGGLWDDQRQPGGLLYGSSPLPGGSPTGTTPLPLSSPFTSGQQAQLQNAFSAAGVWDTIKGLGSDVWGVISSVLPKNADGSVNWGAIGSDVVKWVKDNKDTILAGLKAYNDYGRSKKSDEYAQKALDLAEKTYASKEPLRTAGMAGMLNPSANAPDLTSLKTQGQQGATLQLAPLPMASTANLANAQSIAGGPSSSNPFARTLPLAPAGPGGVQVPIPGLMPTQKRQLTPLPIARDAGSGGMTPPTGRI